MVNTNRFALSRRGSSSHLSGTKTSPIFRSVGLNKRQFVGFNLLGSITYHPENPYSVKTSWKVSRRLNTFILLETQSFFQTTSFRSQKRNHRRSNGYATPSRWNRLG